MYMGNTSGSSGPAGRGPTSPTINDLKNLRIGEVWSPNDTTCCPVTDDSNGSCVKKGFSWPANGEFTWGGLGDTCNTVCAVNYGNTCNSGIIGRKPQVKRTAYLADRAACCKGGDQIINGKTCDPQYINPTSDGCSAQLAKTCVGEALFTDSACQSWCSKNPELCNTNKSQYCKLNMERLNCQNFALKLSQSGDNRMDGTVSDYCARTSGDSFCACQIKPIYTGSNPELQVLNVPSCFDSACINYGYKNASQLAFKCPTSICANTVKVSDIGLSSVGNVIQKCSEGSYGAAAGKVATSPFTLLFFLFACIMAFVIFRSRASEKKNISITSST